MDLLADAIRIDIETEGLLRQCHRITGEIHHQGIFQGIPRPRITSYNVCYTKLLRPAIVIQAAIGHAWQAGHECGKLTLALHQRLFRPLSRCDVPADRDRPRNLSPVVEEAAGVPDHDLVFAP